MTYYKFKQIVRRNTDTDWLLAVYWDENMREVSHWDATMFRIVAGELIKRGRLSR